MTAALLLSWRDGVSMEDGGESSIRVRGPASQIALKQLAPQVRRALQLLSPPGTDEEQLAELVLDEGGPAALARWYHSLTELEQRGLLRRVVNSDAKPLATVLSIGSAFEFALPDPIPKGPLQLSRFAYLRRHERMLVLESPLAHARLILDDSSVAALIASLSEPLEVSQLTECKTGLSSEAVSLLLCVLLATKMIHEVPAEGTSAEEDPPALRSWEFHDLLFHARSRQGRSDAAFGATYRMLGKLDPPLALKPPRAREGIDLFRPDSDRLERDEPRFADVVQQRRSLRQYGSRPISLEQLGEFLYRTGRITKERDAEVNTPRGPLRMGFAARPYPAGGGLYELEIYVAVQMCTGLDSGLYYYDPKQHRLERVCGRTAEFGRLIADGAASAGIGPESVQVLLIVASRFQRLAWKYQSLAYALILKHVGVLFQTMYLTATAMRLAPCALGGGDADVFARAAGTDYYAETSVGEFLLGSLPEAAI